MIKLIAFDWNGTLLNDTNIILKATNQASKHFGYKQISLRQYRKTFTVPIVDFWLANGGKKEDLTVEHNIFYNNYYEYSLKGAKTRPGVAKLLRWLKQKNIRSIIYSNHTKNEIIYQLKRLKITKFISEVLARENFKDQSHLHKRSKEEKLSAYIKKHKFKSTEVISVGDTCEEIEIGHKLGMYTFAITGGENSTARLKAAKPNFLITDLVKIPDIINRLNTYD